MAIAMVIMVALLMVAISVMIRGALVMVLWNYLTPSLFGFGDISFWQAVALTLLVSVLFSERPIAPAKSKSETTGK